MWAFCFDIDVPVSVSVSLIRVNLLFIINASPSPKKGNTEGRKKEEFSRLEVIFVGLHTHTYHALFKPPSLKFSVNGKNRKEPISSRLLY